MAARGTTFIPTPGERNLVRVLAGVSVRQVDIAGALTIDLKTLRKHFREELNGAPARMDAAVVNALFDAARNAVVYGDVKDKNGTMVSRVVDVRPAGVTAAIFWTKARMGWQPPAGAGGQGANADGGDGPAAPPIVVLLPSDRETV